MSTYDSRKTARSGLTLDMKVFPRRLYDEESLLCSVNTFNTVRGPYKRIINKYPKLKDLYSVYERLGIVDIESNLPITIHRSRGGIGRKKYFTHLKMVDVEESSLLTPVFDRKNASLIEKECKKEEIFLASYNLMEKLESNLNITSGSVITVSPLILTGPRFDYNEL